MKNSTLQKRIFNFSKFILNKFPKFYTQSTSIWEFSDENLSHFTIKLPFFRYRVERTANLLHRRWVFIFLLRYPLQIIFIRRFITGLCRFGTEFLELPHLLTLLTTVELWIFYRESESKAARSTNSSNSEFIFHLGRKNESKYLQENEIV